jgi:hypothetical protein
VKRLEYSLSGTLTDSVCGDLINRGLLSKNSTALSFQNIEEVLPRLSTLAGDPVLVMKQLPTNSAPGEFIVENVGGTAIDSTFVLLKTTYNDLSEVTDSVYIGSIPVGSAISTVYTIKDSDPNNRVTELLATPCSPSMVFPSRWVSIDSAGMSTAIVGRGVPALPRDMKLYQNYPNPFNPVTKIRYEIAKAGMVTIQIFDVLGRAVRTLVNEEKAAGVYETSFNGSGLASGLYFYRLTAGNYTNVKKLILLK